MKRVEWWEWEMWLTRDQRWALRIALDDWMLPRSGGFEGMRWWRLGPLHLMRFG